MKDRTKHSYFVVMCDYGSRGMEAIVDPEITRRGIISRIMHGEYRNIVFIHHVDDMLVDDVTHELIATAAELTSEIEARAHDAERRHYA